MKKLTSIIFIAAVAAFMQSCAATKVIPMRQDPLIGKIIHTETRQQVNFSNLIDRIAPYDVIYLSEKHDNPDHHKFQEQVIQALIEKDIKPVLGFEFFAMNDTPDILNFIDSSNVPHTKNSEQVIEQDLRKKLRWDTQSDKMWKFYFDLLSIAHKEKLYAAGIDLSSTLKRRITRKGIDGITPVEKEEVFSTGLQDEDYKNHMMETFKAVHCGMGHGRMQERLYATWVARNDKMAQSITRLAAHSNEPVVVIIGGGHTEYGLGVIDRVSAINPALSQVNIALKEIYVKEASLSEYLEPLTIGETTYPNPADFIRFSQRVSYEDPCVKFREQLKKMKSRP